MSTRLQEAQRAYDLAVAAKDERYRMMNRHSGDAKYRARYRDALDALEAATIELARVKSTEGGAQ